MFTIKDISKITGLSISIISRYLNGHNVRKENKILIDEAVRKTGYTPNEFARSLRAGQTKCIGAVMPSLADGFALSVMHYAEMELKRKGYTLFISDCQNSVKDEIACVKTMIQKRVDALVVLPISDSRELSELAKSGKVPIIIFDQYFENISADYILFENKEAANKACEILVQHGHKNIAILVGPLSDYTPRQRLKGYKKCLAAHGISVGDKFVLECNDYSMQSGYEKTKEIMGKGNRPTAIFATNFDLTLGAIKALNEMDLNVPEDISLMAFDSLPLYEAIKPKLWTIVQPVEEIGRKIAEQIIFRLSESDDSPYTTIFIKYDIKEGASIRSIV
ncbi:MAG: LacI family DNA-binding transcriptional regulator [Clostridia bacterium]|nr:LacI family DNA-binding transcriptional regulator [Clostridia bacterium]